MWEAFTVEEQVAKEDVPMKITMQEVIVAQAINSFCQEVLENQNRGSSQTVETNYGVLRRMIREDENIRQILEPKLPRLRLINRAHHSKIGDARFKG